MPDLAASPSVRDGNRNRCPVDFEADIHGMLHLVSPPFMRLGAGPSGATLEGECRGRGHRTSPCRDHGIWDHLRTSNPIESIFATVRHRTVGTKGALSQKTATLMVFKLVQAAAKTWRRLKGANRLPRVTDGVAKTGDAESRVTQI